MSVFNKNKPIEDITNLSHNKPISLNKDNKDKKWTKL